VVYARVLLFRARRARGLSGASRVLYPCRYGRCMEFCVSGRGSGFFYVSESRVLWGALP